MEKGMTTEARRQAAQALATACAITEVRAYYTSLKEYGYWGYGPGFEEGILLRMSKRLYRCLAVHTSQTMSNVPEDSPKRHLSFHSRPDLASPMCSYGGPKKDRLVAIHHITLSE